jgi:hypothetical protein
MRDKVNTFEVKEKNIFYRINIVCYISGMISAVLHH